MNLTIVASHPVQYYMPWYRALATRCSLEVLFLHRQCAEGQRRAGFSEAFDWDRDLLSGYEHRFMDNRARTPVLGRFFGTDVPEFRQLELADGPVIVSGWNSRGYWQAHQAARRQGLRVYCRGDSTLQRNSGFLKTQFKRAFYPYMLNRFDGHLFVGDRNRAYLRHFGVNGLKLKPVLHCVDVDWFNLRASEAKGSGQALHLRKEWGLDQCDVVFGFVGKFIEIKNLTALIDAVRMIRGVRVGLVMVGSGALGPQLEASAQGANVHFRGFVNQSDMPAHYAAMDCLILPSHSESWGLAVNEALACETPVIVTPGCGVAGELAEFASIATVTGDATAGSIHRAMERFIATRNGPMDFASFNTRYHPERSAEKCLVAVTTLSACELQHNSGKDEGVRSEH